MKGFPRRERNPLPPLFTICSYKNFLYFLRYCSRPSQTVREPFSLSPVGNPSGGCQLQPHGNLTPALSPGHSRASIIIPPACHRHRRVLSPNGRTLVLRLADLSATEVLYRINWYEDGEPSCLSKNKSRHYTRGRLNFFKILCIVFNSVPSSVADNFSSKRHCSSVRYRVPSLKLFAMKTPPPAP